MRRTPAAADDNLAAADDNLAAADDNLAAADDNLAAADDNMVRAWQEVLARSPQPGILREGHLLLLSSGLSAPLLNPAFVFGVPDDPRAAVERVVEHYDSLDLPFVVYFRDETSPGLAESCEHAGLVEHWRPPLMVLDPIPADLPGAPPGLRIAPVEAATADGYVAVLADAFGLSFKIADAVFGRRALEIDGYAGFVGTVDGEPVATSGLYLTEGVAGIYNVSTAEAHRGKGFGAALTWAAVAAGADAGARIAVLQASEQGERVYRRMGFAVPTRYRQFEPVRKNHPS